MFCFTISYKFIGHFWMYLGAVGDTRKIKNTWKSFPRNLELNYVIKSSLVFVHFLTEFISFKYFFILFSEF
jgi:hypothetical protein